MNIFILTRILAVVFVAFFSCQSFAQSYSLIVNNNNMISDSLSKKKLKKEVRKLFLKNKINWPNGNKAIPFIWSGNKQAFVAFQKEILKMKEGTLDKHWKRVKQMRGEASPRSISSQRHLIKLVSENVGAFSFIETKDVNDNVRVVFNF